MEYKIDLTGSGWLEIYLSNNSGEFFVNASYLTDVIGDITSNLLDIVRMHIAPPNLHPNPLRPKEYYLPEAHFPILDEPGCYKWTYFIPEHDKLIITVQHYKEYDAPGGYIDEIDAPFTATLSVWEFAQMHIIQLETILRQYGITGYKKKWLEHEFPLSSYLLLKRVSDFSKEQLFQMGHLDNVRYPLFKNEVARLLELCNTESQ